MKTIVDAPLAPLTLLFENGHVVCFVKPSGLPSVPLHASETLTAVHQALILAPCLQSLRGVTQNRDPQALAEYGLLHRLDTGTSGVLAFAKTEADFLHLRSLWKSGAVKKTYRALVRKKLELKESATPPRAPIFELDQIKLPAVIETPLGHSAKSKRRMLPIFETTPKNRYRGHPQPAHTTLLDRREVRNGIFDCTLQIRTGVMHQIRVHLASLGYPIQGDALYSPVPSSRLWLHAWKLELPLASGETVTIEAPLPDGWP